MLYMVVERFRNGPQPVYERAAEHGRMLLKVPDTSTAGWTSARSALAIS